MVQAHLVAGIALGPQRLLLAARVVGDHLVGRVQNVGGGSVVLLQLDDPAVREVLLEFQYVADVRAAPAVDGLVVVAHHAQVAAPVGEQLDQHILGVVGILILVHQHITEAGAVAFQHRGMIRQQLEGLDQQIIKVQGVEGLQAGFVFHKHVVEHLAAVIPLGFGKPLVRGKQLVLRVGNLRPDLLGRQELFIYIQPFEDFLDHGALVIVIIDNKGAGIAQLFNIAAQNARAGGMKGGNPRVLRLIAYQADNTLLHFAGGLVGKGQRQN